jgi:hypothetical protein
MSMCKKVTPHYSCEYGTTTLNVSPSDKAEYFSLENSKISIDANNIEAVGSYTLTVSNMLPGGAEEIYTHDIEISLSSDELER